MSLWYYIVNRKLKTPFRNKGEIINMQAAALIQPSYEGNLIKIDFGMDTKPDRPSTSLYKSNGIPKASAADPIREPDQIKAMQEYFLSKGQLRDYTLFSVGICFGIRAGDLLDLKIYQVLNPNGTFKAHCELIEAKRRKFNNPAITPQVRQLLTNYLATRDYSLDDPLFSSRNTDKDGNPRPITITQLNRVLKTAAKACDVSGHISSHSLRKTFAYQLLKANPNNDEVKFALQKMLNHDSFQTTLIYCGVAQDAVDKYRTELERSIFN